MGDDAAAPAGEVSAAAEDTVAEPPQKADGADASNTEASDDATVADGDDEDPIEGEDDGVGANEDGDAAPVAATPPMSPVRMALICGLAAVLALSGLVGWLGFRAYQAQQAKDQRNLFIQVGRQGAVNLTTIDFEHVDDDVKRILDSATGQFYDDFQQRAQPFTEVVKQVKSKSVGTVTEAGLEVPESGHGSVPTSAEVLVAVTVNTSIAGQPEQAPRAWRMRILVQQDGDGQAKVSNVEFVP
jgi:Mce-associated membrane protein